MNSVVVLNMNNMNNTSRKFLTLGLSGGEGASVRSLTLIFPKRRCAAERACKRCLQTSTPDIAETSPRGHPDPRRVFFQPNARWGGAVEPTLLGRSNKLNRKFTLIISALCGVMRIYVVYVTVSLTTLNNTRGCQH